MFGGWHHNGGTGIIMDVTINAHQGPNLDGTQANPFKPGGVMLDSDLGLTVPYKVQWEASVLSGKWKFPPGNKQFFGAEDENCSFVLASIEDEMSVRIGLRVFEIKTNFFRQRSQVEIGYGSRVLHFKSEEVASPPPVEPPPIVEPPVNESLDFRISALEVRADDVDAFLTEIKGLLQQHGL